MSSVTSALQFALIAYSQNNRCAALNAVLDKLDTSWTDRAIYTVTADMSIVQNDICSNLALKFIGTPSSDKHINLSDPTLPGPKIGARSIIVVNALTSSPPVNLIFKGGTNAATVTISQDGFCHWLWYDGVGKVYQII
jgi:hypothetical protein